MRPSLSILAALALSSCAIGPKRHPEFQSRWEALYSCARGTFSEEEAQRACGEQYADAQLTGRLATVVPMPNGNVRMDVDGLMDTTVPRDMRQVLTCILVAPVDTARIRPLKAWHTWVTVQGPVRQVSSNRAGNTVLLAPCELLATADGPPSASAALQSPENAHE